MAKKQRIPGEKWGNTGKKLRQFAEYVLWSYPIDARERHRNTVLAHKSEPGKEAAGSKTYYVDGDCCGMLLLTTEKPPAPPRVVMDDPYENSSY